MASQLLIAAPLRVEARGLRGGTREARVLRTGMGPARARRAAKKLAHESASHLAVAGFAGALDGQLEPGHVVVASELAATPGAERLRLAAHPALQREIEACGLRVRVGPVVSMPRVVRGSDRAELAAGGFLAVDMESAWLVEGALGRPLAVVRVVVDGPRHELVRPSFLPNMMRAYRSLAVIARCLERWSNEGASDAPSSPNFPTSQIHDPEEGR